MIFVFIFFKSKSISFLLKQKKVTWLTLSKIGNVYFSLPHFVAADITDTCEFLDSSVIIERVSGSKSELCL